MVIVRIGVPSKGRLSSGSAEILRSIGLNVTIGNDRRLLADVGKGKYQVLFANAKDIPEFVEAGAADVGITGRDLVEEQRKAVDKLLDLNFGSCRLMIAVPETSNVQSVDEVRDGAVVATSFPRLTREYFSSKGKKVDILEISGAAEVTPSIGVAELITDLVETGSTLRVNHLRPIETILESRAVLIANRQSMETKRTEIEELTFALESVIAASRKRYLMANVPASRLEDLSSFLPGVSGPTVMNIMGRSDMVAVHAVIAEEDVNAIIVILKEMGATGILVVPIERMVS